jgi:hypothetical protein
MDDWLDTWLNGGEAPQQSSVAGAAINQNIGGAATQQFNPWTASWGQLGTAGKLGVVSQGLGAFSNLASLYAGFKALSLQKKQFQFAKDAWNKNYGNQVKDYENTLRDQWAARRASAGARGGSYQSLGGYLGDRALTGTTPASHSGG